MNSHQMVLALLNINSPTKFLKFEYVQNVREIRGSGSFYKQQKGYKTKTVRNETGIYEKAIPNLRN